jgi:hypothetical protein
MPTVELAEYFTAERQGGFCGRVLRRASVAAFRVQSRASCRGSRSLRWACSRSLSACRAVNARTGGALEAGLRTTPAATVSAETRRMDKVNKNFRIVKAVEVVLIVAGLALAVLLPHPGNWAAVGLGLLVEAAVLLAFDAFAHQRALVYTRWLQNAVS